MGERGIVTLRVFGPLVLEQDGAKLDAFPTIRCTELLGFMALRPGESVSRRWLVLQLWPDADEPTGRSRLSSALHSIAQRCRERGIDPSLLIEANPRSLTLLEAGVHNEWTEFWTLYHQASSPHETAFESFLHMGDIHRAPLLVDIDAPWAAAHREMVRESTRWLAERFGQDSPNPALARLAKARLEL